MPFRKVRFVEVRQAGPQLVGAPEKVNLVPAETEAIVNTDFVVEVLEPKDHMNKDVVVVEQPPSMVLIRFHTGEARLALGTVDELKDRFNQM